MVFVSFLWLVILCYTSWQQPLYRFVPFALAGVVYLLWIRWPESDDIPARASSYSGVAYLASCFLLACCAIVLWFPALATLSMIGAVMAIGVMLGVSVGKENLRDVLPAWAVLWLLIPLPFGWDASIVQWFQPATIRIGSLLLDGIAVPHLLDETVLDLSDRRMLLAHACGGMPSVFAIMAFAGLFTAWRQMPALPAALLLVSSVIWAMFADVLCVAAIAIGYSTFGIDLTDPFANGWLFAVVFAIAVGMIISTEAGFYFFLRTVPENLPTGDVNPVTRIWNRTLTGVSGEGVDEEDEQVQEQEVPVEVASEVSDDEPIELPEGRLTKAGKYLWRLLSPVTGLSFVVSWFGSRCWPAMFWAFPAIAAAIVVPVLCLEGNRQRCAGSPLALWYTKAGCDAVEAKRFHEADLWFRKLTQWDSHSELATYGLALVAESQGDRERARQLMSEIAPDDKRGYARAHLWLARDLVRSEEIPSATDVDLIEHHLLATVASLPGETDSQETLGRMYLARGQYDKAAEHMAIAARKRPELLLVMARIHGARGEAKARDRVAQQAKDHFASKVESGAANVNDRMMLAASQVILGEYAAAEVMILRGLRQSTDPGYRQLLVQLYISWFDKIKAGPTPDLAKLLALIEKAVRYAPKDPEVVGRLAMLAATSGTEAENAKKTLDDVLAKGVAPAMSHFILGTLASEKKDFAGAVFHLEQAYKLSPEVPAVAGNLAFSLAQLDPPQLERALKLVNEAVSSSKDDPQMRGMRGYVLCRLARYDAAITDLEIALRVTPNNSWIRETLATAYEALGDHELAAAYRRMAATGADSSSQAESRDAKAGESPANQKPDSVQKPPT